MRVKEFTVSFLLTAALMVTAAGCQATPESVEGGAYGGENVMESTDAVDIEKTKKRGVKTCRRHKRI